ncbi:MAG: peptide deformylase [Cyanobacteria bacterium P01_H01_bin.121]
MVLTLFLDKTEKVKNYCVEVSALAKLQDNAATEQATLGQAIAELGNPVLRQVAQTIESPTDAWVQTLIDTLIAKTLACHGVGIAAPQLAESCQLIVVASRPNLRYPDAPTMEPTALLNPQIVDCADTDVDGWEGCLSVPGLRGLVRRSYWIDVAYTDRQGQACQQRFTDFVARIVQHEIDHLNGTLFIDRVAKTTDLMSEAEWLKQVAKIT